MKVATTMNGIEVENLMGAIELLKDRPELARFKFKTTNQWIDGTFNRASNPAAEEQLSAVAAPDAPKRTKPHVHDIDEPPALFGSDRGANPVEYLLASVSGCVTTTFIAYAAAQGVKIDELRTELEGDIDLRAFLGITKEVRPGYKEIRIRFHVKSDAPREKLEELMKLAVRRSPSAESVQNGVPLVCTIAE